MQLQFFLLMKKKEGTFFVAPSSSAINLLIANVEILLMSKA